MQRRDRGASTNRRHRDEGNPRDTMLRIGTLTIPMNIHRRYSLVNVWYFLQGGLRQPARLVSVLGERELIAKRTHFCRDSVDDGFFATTSQHAVKHRRDRIHLI